MCLILFDWFCFPVRSTFVDSRALVISKGKPKFRGYVYLPSKIRNDLTGKSIFPDPGETQNFTLKLNYRPICFSCVNVSWRTKLKRHFRVLGRASDWGCWNFSYQLNVWKFLSYQLNFQYFSAIGKFHRSQILSMSVKNRVILRNSHLNPSRPSTLEMRFPSLSVIEIINKRMPSPAIIGQLWDLWHHLVRVTFKFI